MIGVHGSAWFRIVFFSVGGVRVQGLGFRLNWDVGLGCSDVWACLFLNPDVSPLSLY